MVVQVQNIGCNNSVLFLVISVVSKVYICLGNSLDIFRLLIIIDVYLDNRREAVSKLVRVKSHWQQLVTTIVNQSLVSCLFCLRVRIYFSDSINTYRLSSNIEQVL